MGFTLFELLYGKVPAGILYVVRENWEGPSESRSEIQYVPDLITKSTLVPYEDHLSHPKVWRLPRWR